MANNQTVQVRYGGLWLPAISLGQGCPLRGVPIESIGMKEASGKVPARGTRIQSGICNVDEFAQQNEVQKLHGRCGVNCAGIPMFGTGYGTKVLGLTTGGLTDMFKQSMEHDNNCREKPAEAIVSVTRPHRKGPSFKK